MTEPVCPVDIEFGDLQGNILTAYGRLGFPFGRFALVNVSDAKAGRKFIEALRHRVTTAVRWPSYGMEFKPGRDQVPRPAVTVNLAFTYRGLMALGVPTRTLKGMPDEFIDGMIARCAILGDGAEPNKLTHWDKVWDAENRGKDVHILVMLNAQMQETDISRPVPELAATCAEIEALCDQLKGVRMLSGHSGPDPLWQYLETVREDGMPSAKEHFGYTDGISDPVFLGQHAQGEEQERSIGGGATDGEGVWRPLAAGEFLLGWPDEAQEIPGSAMPLDFSRNGTFFAYRKLHQDVATFKSWVDKTAATLQRVWRIADFDEARETLLAKMAGRWTDGVPLSKAPTHKDWVEFNRKYPATGPRVRDKSERSRLLVDFGYSEDQDGIACPLGAHLRRASSRDMLDPRADAPNKSSRMGSALNNRRRVLRRGLPYGHHGEDDQGVIMLVVCSSLQRQFEFVQQQWINYGLDSSSGNDVCPLIGNHGENSKFVIPADPGSGNPPFIATGLKPWVTTRGGDYFFMPSMTALRMIGMGVVDPT